MCIYTLFHNTSYNILDIFLHFQRQKISKKNKIDAAGVLDGRGDKTSITCLFVLAWNVNKKKHNAELQRNPPPAN